MSSDLETKKVLEIVLSDEAVFEKIRERVFSYIDVDNNGTIDKQEIEDFVSKICENTSIEKLDAQVVDSLFKELDTDGSNTISADELGVLLRGIFKAQLKQIKKNLANADKEPKEKPFFHHDQDERN